jgi:peptidyl-dipeptidase Dcp
VPFDCVRVADFKPALEAAMEQKLAEVERIAADPDTPTFDNTVLALERAGRAYQRVTAVYGVWAATLNKGDFQAVETEMEPKIAAFSSKISQHAGLFARVDTVYRSPGFKDLDAVQQRLVWFHHTHFVRAGAQLDPPRKARVAAINERLAVLFAQFSQNLLAEEADHVLYLRRPEELAGLPDGVLAAAAAAAAERGHSGAWAVQNTRSSMEPFLTYSMRRDLRERVWRTYYSRCDNGDARDNKAVIVEILALRAERARLLGFATHAHWRLADSMAETPEQAMALMLEVWPSAVARVREEVRDMQAMASADGITIAPWDYRFYAERVRKAKYDLDMHEVKPYLQLEKLREGMFWAAGRLYGLSFTRVEGLPVAHPDMRVWEVATADRHVGFWYFDPYARPGKNSGAWMSEYRTQDATAGAAPIVSNNTNFLKSADGAPVQISWDDAVALFHEFGHALHGLCSNVAYPSLAGTNTVRDFVEFPSQLNENLLLTPEVLSRFALHAVSGAPMPATLADRIAATQSFNQGFATVEYLASALVDMRLHLADAKVRDPDVFERETLAELGMPAELVMRHRTPQFAHIFSSDGYSAGYYAYLWAAVLDHDGFQAFLEAGGPFDAQVARRYHDEILAVGNSVDPGTAYRRFRGRAPTIHALLRSRGFPVPDSRTVE